MSFDIGDVVEASEGCYLFRGTIATKQTTKTSCFYGVDVETWKEQNEDAWSDAGEFFGRPPRKLIRETLIVKKLETLFPETD